MFLTLKLKYLKLKININTFMIRTWEHNSTIAELSMNTATTQLIASKDLMDLTGAETLQQQCKFKLKHDSQRHQIINLIMSFSEEKIITSELLTLSADEAKVNSVIKSFNIP